LDQMHTAGMRGVADIVINHRCGDKQDSEGRWNVFSGGARRPSFADDLNWGGWAVVLGDQYSDGTGENTLGKYDQAFDAAPDIDHRNPKVQQGIRTWLRWLRLEVGFDAFRFDFCKGYAADAVGTYIQRSEPSWAVGEVWNSLKYEDDGRPAYNQDKHRQDLCNWVTATGKASTAFDFTTKGILQEAVRNHEYWRLKDTSGKPPGLLGWWPAYAVTFIDNHDTGSTQRHWPFPDDKTLVGYAYILTHPGMPCLFWDHLIDWGEDHRRRIIELTRARRDSGMKVDAKVVIEMAEDGIYLAEIGGVLRVQLGNRSARDPDASRWGKPLTGPNYRVWVRRIAASAVEKKVPTPSPQPPAAKQSSKVVQVPKPVPLAPELTPDVESDFLPIDIDGTTLTHSQLRSMNLAEVEALGKRLKPVMIAIDACLSKSQS